MRDVFRRTLASMKPRDEITVTERSYRALQPRLNEFRRDNPGRHFLIKSDHGSKTIRRIA